ncbi:MAG: hypothetical protein ACLT8E_05160 [Akkermansia sp.]
MKRRITLTIAEGETGDAAHVLQNFNVIVAVSIHDLRYDGCLVVPDFQGYKAVFIQVIPGAGQKAFNDFPAFRAPNRAV